MCDLPACLPGPLEPRLGHGPLHLGFVQAGLEPAEARIDGGGGHHEDLEGDLRGGATGQRADQAPRLGVEPAAGEEGRDAGLALEGGEGDSRLISPEEARVPYDWEIVMQ